MANMTIYRPLQELQEEVDRLFDDFSSSFFNGEGTRTLWSPPADLIETGDSYEVQLDLPGLARDDVQLTFENGVLKISGEREVTYEENITPIRTERWAGRFTRMLRFSQNVDPDGIEAHFEGGVLMVRVPKTEKSRARQIEIS